MFLLWEESKMTGIIKVNTQKLKSTATTFNSTAQQIQNLTNNMTSIVNGLSGSVWSGDAANAYKKKFSDLNDDIAKMVKMVSEHATDLNEMAAAYESAENDNINASNSLSGDVII